ncbi:MAG TPA: hypothetical protein VER55_15335 [Ardenticatenaceae bacterium]|nr:hypothetical protein [Ardenticatenaceae bacterium]
MLWLANLIVLAVVFPLSAYGPEQLAWRLGAASNPLAVSLFTLTWALAGSALAGVIFVWSLRRSGF